MKKITEILSVLYAQENNPEIYKYMWLIIGIIIATAVVRCMILCRRNRQEIHPSDTVDLSTEKAPEVIQEPESESTDWMDIFRDIEAEAAQFSKERKASEEKQESRSGVGVWEEDTDSDLDSLLRQMEKCEKKKKKTKKKKGKAHGNKQTNEIQHSENMLEDDLWGRQTQDTESLPDEAYRYGDTQEESS